jgi:DNA (cytosine-5)-methyltransferase 1
MLNKKLNVIDLFCGCGGFSQGFKQANYNILLGIDSWKDAITTYQYNFENAKVINEDITKIDGKSIIELLNVEPDDVDVIIGGPPCQGFSISGKRMIDDPRNVLYKSFVEMVSYIKPKVFVMENVPGLIRLFGGKVKEEVINDFTELGYNVSCEILSSDKFGVPQVRKRVFFVGINKEKIKNTEWFTYPKETHGDDDNLLPIVTCEDAISDLDFISDEIANFDELEYLYPPKTDYQKMIRNKNTTITNHVATIHNVRTKEIISMVPDGGNYKDLPEYLHSTRKVNIAWTRMNSKKACFTIDTGHNHHFHYRANRVPTARESARIQSFPDDFKFLGIKTSQLKQVGNAVPPLLAEAIAKQVSLIIERG